MRCDDTGMVYAMQAERYYDRPDEEDYQWSCGECAWFDGCPEESVNWGICEDRGEWKHRDDEECGRFMPKEPSEEPDPDYRGFFDPEDREDR